MATPSERSGKLITAILPKAHALPLLKALKEKGITRSNFAFARGFDIHDPEQKSGMPTYEEKEIVTVVAKNQAEAEELFALVYELGDVDRLGGGLVYMTSLSGAMPFVLPEIEESASASSKPSEPRPADASI